MSRFVWSFFLVFVVTPINSYEVDFDSPEGWAMAYTTASSLNLSQSVTRSLEAGQFRIATEISSIPRLSEEQQKVGFNGVKDEDLNKSPIFGRLRLSIGLKWNTTAEISITPPFEISGAKPKKLWGLALSRPLREDDNFRLDVRFFMMRGKVEADVTCSSAKAKLEPYTPENPVGCIGPSSDQLSVNHEGIEAVLSGKRFSNGLRPWVTFAATQMDPSVKIDAHLDFGREIGRVYSQGTTETYTIGLDYQFSENYTANIASSYTPLDVLRSENLDERDSFWNFRVGFSHSF